MGKAWEIPSVPTWKACFRVLKPGGYVLSFAGTRTWDIMSIGLRAAGFDNRDTISSLFSSPCLQWLHCLPEDTEVLTEAGWRKHGELHVGDIVACWDPSDESIRPMPLTKKWESPWDGPMEVFRNDDVDCVVTPNHRVYHQVYERKQVDGIRRGVYSSWQALQAAEVTRTKRIKLPTSGFCNGPGAGGVDYVTLAAWLWTEGGFDLSGNAVRIYQSETADPENVQMIDALLDRLHAKHSRYSRDREWVYKGKSSSYTEICWYLSGELADQLRADLPNKIPSWAFIWKMTIEERRTFYKACMAGDGSELSHQFYQKGEGPLGIFQGFLSLMGYSGHVYMRPDRPGQGHVNVRTKSSTELTIAKLQETTGEYYKGQVWCIEVPTGAFVVRRNGQVFITGNSQGFPKSTNISKKLRERARNSKGDPALVAHMLKVADAFEGFGTALKPAWEPILCFRKPIEESTVSDQIMTTGTGALNIDGTRIKHANAEDFEKHKSQGQSHQSRGRSVG